MWVIEFQLIVCSTELSETVDTGFSLPFLGGAGGGEDNISEKF